MALTREQREEDGVVLAVDWTRCKGHGLCAELLPEDLDLDDWGFPIVAGRVPQRRVHLAERASAACPVMALRLRPA
ncbi:MAG: ferredoxin [Actinomycetia bacterium]|jgi:ferredoxin|nr:ferredoxin [Actinomycetes bacterium]